MSKTIVIIGAGPGIGLAIARRFGQEGFRVALLGRNEQKLTDLVARLTEEGIEATGFQADVMNTGGLTATLEKVIAAYGSIDVLEYGPAAAMETMRPVLEADLESVSYQFGFLVLGAMAAVRTVLPGMQQRKQGTLLFTTAVSAQHPINMTANYGIAAGAQLNYARLLHDNLKEDNIFTGIVSVAALVASSDAQHRTDVADFPATMPIITAGQVADQHWSLYINRDRCEVVVGDVERLLASVKK